jgi:hypothetical protein
VCFTQKGFSLLQEQYTEANILAKHVSGRNICNNCILTAKVKARIGQLEVQHIVIG